MSPRGVWKGSGKRETAENKRNVTDVHSIIKQRLPYLRKHPTKVVLQKNLMQLIWQDSGKLHWKKKKWLADVSKDLLAVFYLFVFLGGGLIFFSPPCFLLESFPICILSKCCHSRTVCSMQSTLRDILLFLQRSGNVFSL